MIILGLQTWSIVNNPGFLCHHAIYTPHFDIGSEKYYRSMLNPAYEKINLATKVMLNEKNAETVSISLDAWSSFHHEYLGMMAHFISDKWERIKFCLSCSKFDEKHTASNIFQRLENVAKEWELKDKITVCLRENAANIKAAFKEPQCVYKFAGCLNHSLQLVIKKELFSLQSAVNLIEKCRKLCTHASFSNSFFAELFKQQDVQTNNFDRLGLKNDVPIHWNSTYYMLERILYLKSTIATTLLIRPSSGIEFTVQNWNLCEKLVNILAIFEEATKLLSGKDTCISACIPIVTTILKSFEVPSDDKEVIGMKNALKKAMEARFFDLETIDHFAIATLLVRFKHHFFRSQEASQAAKKQVFLELDSSILSQNETTSVMKTTSIKNTGFSSMMQNIIAQSQNPKSKNPTSKLAKEV